MNKKLYVVIIVLVGLVIGMGAYIAVIYYMGSAEGEWLREEINEGDYVIVGHEIGKPILCGPTEVEIAILDNKRHDDMVIFRTAVDNHGARLQKENCLIESNSEYMKLVFRDADHNVSGVYRFYYDDF